MISSKQRPLRMYPIPPTEHPIKFPVSQFVVSVNITFRILTLNFPLQVVTLFSLFGRHHRSSFAIRFIEKNVEVEASLSQATC